MDPKVIAKRLRNLFSRRKRKANDADKSPSYEAQVQQGDWNRSWKVEKNKTGRFVVVPRRDRQANSSKYDPATCHREGKR